MSLNKTRIEWVRNPEGTKGYTWNPVTGCLHGCAYCYARNISNRFEGTTLKRKFIEDTQVEQVIDGVTKEFLLDDHPGFYPTFWCSRLIDPILTKKSSTIFVGSMADLFGKWVPSMWIERVLNTVKKCPQHIFLFLTKNGSRMCLIRRMPGMDRLAQASPLDLCGTFPTDGIFYHLNRYWEIGYQT